MSNAPASNLVPLTHLLDEAEEPTPWLVEGLIPESELVMFHGPPHAGKTYVVLDLGLRLAFGKSDFHGYSLGGRIRPVAYIPSEGRRGVSRRIGSWLKTHADYAFDELAFLPHTWQKQVVTEDGEVEWVEETEDWEPPFYRYDADDFVLDPQNPEPVETLSRHIQSLAEVHKVPPVVIIDVVSDFTPGVDENHRDFGHALRLVHPDNLGGSNGLSPSVFLVHHEGHTASGRPRGSSSVIGLVDVLVGLEYQRDGTPPTQTNIRLSNAKQRNEDSFPPFVLQLSRPDPTLATPVIAGRPDPTLERILLSSWSKMPVNGARSSAQDVPTDSVEDELDARSVEIVRAVVKLKEARADDLGPTLSDLASETGIPKGTLSGKTGKLKRIQELGLLAQGESGRWDVTRQGRDLAADSS